MFLSRALWQKAYHPAWGYLVFFSPCWNKYSMLKINSEV